MIYQLFVDVGFLNDTVFGTIGRAGGTMYDANLSGTVAALWMGGLIVLALRTGPYAGAVDDCGAADELAGSLGLGLTDGVHGGVHRDGCRRGWRRR